MDIFQLVELPNDIALPVHLQKVKIILRTKGFGSFTAVPEYLSARQQLIREAL